MTRHPSTTPIMIPPLDSGGSAAEEKVGTLLDPLCVLLVSVNVVMLASDVRADEMVALKAFADSSSSRDRNCAASGIVWSSVYVEIGIPSSSMVPVVVKTLNVVAVGRLVVSVDVAFSRGGD